MRRSMILVAVCLLLPPRATTADVVLTWNEIAVNAAIQTNQSPFAQARFSDARVYGGIHFRFDQDAGERLGREIGTSVYKNNLRPIRAEQ